MSDLPEYLNGSRVFDFPVYAVWGNHEDKSVVERFRSGEYRVRNLNIIDEARDYHFDHAHLFGLGGNIIPGPKLFDEPLAGARGQIWSTRSQFELLRQNTEKSSRLGEIRVLVTHVSPGKEPLLWRMAAHLRADLAISGHMNTPYCAVWNEYTVRGESASQEMVESRRAVVERARAVERAH